MSKKSMSKKKRRLRTILVVDALLLAAIIGVVAYQELLRPMELKGGDEVVINLGEEFEDPGTSSKLAEVTGEVDNSTVGDYTITYTRGSTTLTRIVHVVDPSRLVIGLKGSARTLVREGDPYIESGAFAVDKDKGAVPEGEITISGEVDTSKPGTYQVYYNASSGYVTQQVSRTVEVVPKSEFKADTDGIAVLMYHYIYTSKDKPDDLNVNYTIDTDFEAQLKYFVDNGYYFPSFAELRAYVEGKIALPAKSVILTFDDAQHGFFDYGVPLLEKYKVPATSFVIGTQNGVGKIKLRANPYVQFQSHSYDMHKGGGNIGHGGVISAMSQSGITADLKKSFAMTGNTDAFAYPYGDVTNAGKAAVKDAGTKCAFTTVNGKVEKGDDFRCLSRVRVSGGNSLNVFVSRL